MNKFAKLTLQTARDTPKTAFAPSFDLLLVPSRSISFLSTRDCWVVSVPCKKQMRHSSEAVASQHFWPADWQRASSPKWLPDDAYRDSRPEDVVDTCHSLSDALSIPSLTTVTEFMGLMDAGRSPTGLYRPNSVCRSHSTVGFPRESYMVLATTEMTLMLEVPNVSLPDRSR